MQGHEPNGYAPRAVGIARRVADGGRRSPSVVSGGEVPGNDAPFLIRAATATPDQQAAELEREAAGLMNAFTPSPTLTLEFSTAEERDEVKAMIAERAKADGIKGGTVIFAALKRKAKK